MRLITTGGDVVDVELAEDGLVVTVTDTLTDDHARIPLGTADVLHLMRAMSNEHNRWRNAKLAPPVTPPALPDDDRPLDFEGWRRALKATR